MNDMQRGSCPLAGCRSIERDDLSLAAIFSSSIVRTRESTLIADGLSTLMKTHRHLTVNALPALLPAIPTRL